MPSPTSQLREQLFEQVGAPFDFGRVKEAFGSSAAAADFLGLRRPPRGAPPERRAAMIRHRKTFQQSWSRWNRGVRRPRGGVWPRLQNAGQRRTVIDRVRRFGLIVHSWSGEIDVYGSDVRDREIDQEQWLAPEDLADAGGHDFFRGVEANDWTEAARAVASAWFASYTGNDLSLDVSWGDGELSVSIPTRERGE